MNHNLIQQQRFSPCAFAKHLPNHWATLWFGIQVRWYHHHGFIWTFRQVYVDWVLTWYHHPSLDHHPSYFCYFYLTNPRTYIGKWQRKRPKRRRCGIVFFRFPGFSSGLRNRYWSFTSQTSLTKKQTSNWSPVRFQVPFLMSNIFRSFDVERGV